MFENESWMKFDRDYVTEKYISKEEFLSKNAQKHEESLELVHEDFQFDDTKLNSLLYKNK